MQSNKTMGKRIEEVRKQHNLTQAELADRVGVKRETVNQWEAESRMIKAPDLSALVDALDTSADYLLRGIHANQIEAFQDTGLDGDAISKLQKMNRGKYCNVQFCDFIKNDAFEFYMISWGEYRNASSLYYEYMEKFRRDLQGLEKESDPSCRVKLSDEELLLEASKCREKVSSPLFEISNKLLNAADEKNYSAFKLQQSMFTMEKKCDTQQRERIEK